MKPGGWILIALLIIFGCGGMYASLASIPQVNDVRYTHEDHQVNLENYSPYKEFYEVRITQNCTLKMGAVKIVKGPSNGIYLLQDSGGCQGWGPSEWLHLSPARN